MIAVPPEVHESAVGMAILQIKKMFDNRLEFCRTNKVSGKGADDVVETMKDSVLVRDMFDIVLYVAVLKDWTIVEIEDDIARQVSFITGSKAFLDRPYTFDAVFRGKEVILLVNDVHERIKPLTISKRIPNLKVVFATRSYWSIMPWTGSADKEIEMTEHLEPWFLFCREVGHIIDTYPTIRSIAASIVSLCDGILLAIRLLARALKGIAKTDIWVTALHNMQSPVVRNHKFFYINAAVPVINALKFVLARNNNLTRKYLSYLMEHHLIRSLRVPPLTFPLKLDDRLIITQEEEANIVNHLVDSALFFMDDSSHSMIERLVYLGLKSYSSMLDTYELLLDGESNAINIRLMNNSVPELPESPSCPMLERLFMQKNNDLTVIPSSFFQHMTTLQILDLSFTSISSLPESFFHLSGLKKFFLRGCELFMELPSQIGELKNLEELDLEGTAILYLPETIRYLTKLTCLKVSFYGDMHCNDECNPKDKLIPDGVLSGLSALTELSIYVNPADKRWEEAAKAVIREVANLKELKSLEMYLPDVELLDELEAQIPKFRLTLGRHQRHIRSRMPPGVEAKYEDWSRCLKYVNGNEPNAHIQSQVKNVLKCADSFFVKRHYTLTEVSSFGIENMQKLKSLVVGECDKLQTIIDGGNANRRNEDCDNETDNFLQKGGPALPCLKQFIIYKVKNLTSIWKGAIGHGNLCHLSSLTLNRCPQLKVLFTPALVYSLPLLRELIVEDCYVISSIVTWDSHSQNDVPNLKTRRYMELLKRISLHHLPNLESISSGLHMAPLLKRMSIFDCPKLQSLSTKEVSSGRLKVIRGESHWWDALQWNDISEWKGKRPPFVPIRNGSHFKT